MSHDDADITTPIPRGRLRKTADRVRVRHGAAIVEQDSDEIARQAGERLMVRSHPANAVVDASVGKSRGRRRVGLRKGAVVADHYRVLDRIARGGTAIVYQAEHLGMGRRVALKILTPPGNATDDLVFERRFVLEARTLAALHHPNIVEVLDFGRVEDGRCYLAMELLEGPRLTEFFRDPQVTAEERLEALIGVAKGIEHAHGHGVIHRDIKLSNVMVVQRAGRPVVKVLDFGLAKLLDADTPELTQHGVTMGSPHFMSPEQARGWELDEGTDIYSMGVLAWCAFTGDFPYAGPTSTATMLQHVIDPVPHLDQAKTSIPVPPGLGDVVHRCMAKGRESRYATMADLVAALEAVRTPALQPPAPLAARAAPPADGSLPPGPLAVSPSDDFVLPSPTYAPMNATERRLVLLACLLMSVACLWWQERGVVQPPWVRAVERIPYE